MKSREKKVYRTLKTGDMVVYYKASRGLLTGIVTNISTLRNGEETCSIDRQANYRSCNIMVARYLDEVINNEIR